jgi:uncharacterized protein
MFGLRLLSSSSWLMKISRRSFLTKPVQLGLAVTGCGAAIIPAAAFASTTEDLEVSHLTVPLKRLPASFEGFKIGFISDIHYGESLSETFLRYALAALNSFNIDILLLGGDYLWVPFSNFSKTFQIVRNRKFYEKNYNDITSSILSDLASIIKSTISAPYGTIGCLGNHDHWHNARVCKNIFEKAGIKILVNEAIPIIKNRDRILLGAVDDFMTGVPKLPLTMVQSSSSHCSILLSHNPEYVIWWNMHKKELPADLTLCGHTHGGQIRFPGTQFTPFCNVSNSSFLAGLYAVNDRLNFTSRGLGVVEVPIRIACPPEVSVITLTQAIT